MLTLETFDPPQPAQGLVRIAVEVVPGTEVAGTVVAAPAGSGFSPGDRVLALLRQQGLLEGGYSELVEALPEYTVRLPDEMPFDQAAGFFVNYQTGWFGLHRRAGARGHADAGAHNLADAHSDVGRSAC